MPRIHPATADDSDRRLPHLALLLGAVLLLGVSLAACNTMQGAGQDLTAAGETLSDTAEDVAD
jgi:predicted small secreted protein